MVELKFKKTYNSITAHQFIIIKYGIAFTLGLAMGFRLIPSSVVAFFYMGGIFLCGWYGIQKKMMQFFTYLPFVCYTEPYVRGFIKAVPYLSIEYMYIFVFLVLIFRDLKKNKPHSYAFVFMILFGLVEFLNGLFPDDPHLLRPILINSISLIVVIVWSCLNRLSPILIHHLLTYIKIATVYLAGIVLVAHIVGGISYNSASNFGSSNGLAPVQLSGYLGFGSILFLFSFMNPEESKYRIINIVLFIICATVMILTFSRGGLYFIAIIMLIYFYFHRASFKSYFKFIFFIPIGWVIYDYVVQETGGAIVKRYKKTDTSNRDVLIIAGFKLFLDEPILGVGTSNYPTQVVKRGYFFQISTAHNEFVRALAEHGIIGFFTYWMFFLLMFKTIWGRHGPNKEFSVYFLVLFCLIIVHNGLKISIQHVLMMIAIANPNVIVVKRKIKNVFKPSVIQQQPQTS